MVIFEICIVKVSLHSPLSDQCKMLNGVGPLVAAAWYPIPKSRRRRLAISAVGENDLARNASITKTKPHEITIDEEYRVDLE